MGLGATSEGRIFSNLGVKFSSSSKPISRILNLDSQRKSVPNIILPYYPNQTSSGRNVWTTNGRILTYIYIQATMHRPSNHVVFSASQYISDYNLVLESL
jgi:hypothetical protein